MKKILLFFFLLLTVKANSQNFSELEFCDETIMEVTEETSGYTRYVLVDLFVDQELPAEFFVEALSRLSATGFLEGIAYVSTSPSLSSIYPSYPYNYNAKYNSSKRSNASNAALIIMQMVYEYHMQGRINIMDVVESNE